ncbi:hypothetical protein HPE56_02630 [Maribacter sp. ANRC-HE7]|uniref:STAS/SEC14 domain-containing protein n=1 Tax=Maribacter aquimaris TaxID=2737171 RepID=A0ABR7UWW1_9FLAO|nr:hypothetical protein [Maribacter aquimaris]MBD0776677.1 hypothetical protein [Maribacter aquimaris]
MGWKSEHHSVENRLELTLEGVMDYDSWVEAVLSIMESAKKHNTIKYLVDCSSFLPKFSRGEIFELLNKHFPEWDIPLGSKVSLIEPKDMSTKIKVKFYVYAVNKLGLEAAIFKNRKKAMAWLNKE